MMLCLSYTTKRPTQLRPVATDFHKPESYQNQILTFTSS